MTFPRKQRLFFPALLLISFLISGTPEKVRAKELPESFTLSDCNIVTDIYSQGSYNTCWAISAADALSMKLKNMGENKTISPWYLAYSAYTGANKFSENIDPNDPFSLFFKGGSNYISSAVLTSGNGMVYDSDIPYGTHPDVIEDFNINASLKSNGKVPTDYIINDICNLTPWISQKKQYDNDYIKSFIYNKNPVCATCSLDESFINSETFAMFCNTNNYSCHTDPNYHAILIVGWDDNFSKNNFSKTCMPKNDGAWLVKNSWGKNWGNDGYMWISYEDSSLREAVVYSDIAKNIYDNIYQYDEFGWTTSITPSMVLNIVNIKDENNKDFAPSDTGYMANVFRADDDEYIYDVSFYTLDENCEYEIYIYSSLDDRSIPTSGEIIAHQKGTEKYPGYHTISLDEKPRIKKGSYFSVVAKIKNTSSVHTVPIDACIILSANYIEDSSKKYIGNINSIIFRSRKNESFVSCNGKDWADLMLSKNGIQKNILINDRSYFPQISDDETPLQFYMGNVCLKALTVDYTPCYGDINDDGVVTAIDLAQTVNHLLGKKNLSNERFADLDKDTKVTVSDLLLLKSYINSYE